MKNLTSRLHHLNLNELQHLGDCLRLFGQVGEQLVDGGFDPIFDIGQGTALTITLLAAIRATDGVKAFDLSDPLQKAGAAQAVAKSAADFEQLQQTPFATFMRGQPPEGSPYPPPAVVLPEEPLNSDPLPDTPADLSCAVSLEPQPHADVPVTSKGQDGGAEAKQPLPQVAPLPPPSVTKAPEVTIAPASNKPAPWSIDEDEIAIGTAVAMRLKGKTGAQIAETIAAQVLRPVQGVAFRLNNALKSRIHMRYTEQLAEAPKQKAQAAKAVQLAAPADTLDVHLLGLGDRDKWPLERDLALMELSVENGWKAHEIAEDMGISARDVQGRYDKLTGLDPETKTRRWRREAVLGVLGELCRLVGKDEAAA